MPSHRHFSSQKNDNLYSNPHPSRTVLISFLILHSSGYACVVRKPQSRQGFSYIQLTRPKQSVIIRTSNWSFLKTASMSIRSFFDPVLSGIFESNFSFSKIRQIPRLEYILTINPETITDRYYQLGGSIPDPDPY